MKNSIEILNEGDPVPVPAEPSNEKDIVANWQDCSRNPLVSIICHSYNHVAFIKSALDGFLTQKTDFPFEIIVHDDASPDGTAEIIRSYAKKYPKIFKTILQEENQYSKGKKPAQFTFPAAKGKYIAFCEGDDYWLDKFKLSKQAEFLENNNEFAVCGHDACLIKDGKLLKKTKLTDSQKEDLKAEELQKKFSVSTLTAMFVNKVSDIQPEQLKVVNGDSFLFSRLGEFGGYKYLANIEPGVYRQHSGGVWSQVDEMTRKANSINSYYWMMQYYNRIGKYNLAYFFSRQIISNAYRENKKFSFSQVFFIFFAISKNALKILIKN